MNRADELEQAAARVAGRKAIPAHDPVAAGMKAAPPPGIPLWASIAVIISTAALLGLLLSFLMGVAPAHIIIVAILVAWLLRPWRWWRGGRIR